MNSTTIEKHAELNTKVKNIGDVYTENFITLRDRSRDNKVDFVNSEGKEHNITEYHVWQEMLLHPDGDESNAAIFLRNKYPELFEMQDQYKELQKELSEFEAKNFGFRGNEMTLANLISIIDGIVEFRMNKK